MNGPGRARETADGGAPPGVRERPPITKVREEKVRPQVSQRKRGMRKREDRGR